MLDLHVGALFYAHALSSLLNKGLYTENAFKLQYLFVKEMFEAHTLTAVEQNGTPHTKTSGFGG